MTYTLSKFDESKEASQLTNFNREKIVNDSAKLYSSQVKLSLETGMRYAADARYET